MVTDVVGYLSRNAIEQSQAVSRRFRSASDYLLHTGNVPIRGVKAVRVIRRNFFTFIFGQLDSDSGLKEVELAGDDDYDKALEATVRHAKVDELTIVGGNKIEPWTFGSNDWGRLMAACSSTTILDFRLHDINLCPLTPEGFKRIIELRGIQEVFIRRCRMRSVHVDNEFLRRFSEGKAADVSLFITLSPPCDRATYDVDDDGVMQFVFSSVGKQKRSLFLHHASVTPQLPGKVVEARTEREDDDSDRVHFCVAPVTPVQERNVAAMDFTKHEDGKRTIYTLRALHLGFVFTETDLTPGMFGMF